MKRFAFILLCLLLLSILIPQISPMTMVANTDGLITTAVSDTDATDFLDCLAVEILEEESIQHSIACFAVRQDGVFALGFDSIDTHTVHVYDQTGDFQYGFKFKLPGSFGIFFSGENLLIYSSRGGCTVKYDRASQFAEVHKVTNAPRNNEIIRSLMDGTEAKNSGGTYSLERNIGIMTRSYSKVVFTDGSNEKVLYDISRRHATAVFLKELLVAGFIAVLSFVVPYCINKNKKLKK